MSATPISVQNIAITGLNPTFTAAASGAGNSFVNDGNTFLQVTNAGGGAIDATIAAQVTTAQAPGFGTLSVANTVVNVPNGQSRMIGPFPITRFNNTSGSVVVTFSGVSSVTIAAIRLTPAS